MEITYSEDIVIRDEALLATLSIFCDKIYLPYPHAAQDLKKYIIQTGSGQSPSMQRILDAIDSDPVKSFPDQWHLQHEVLFREGVLEYLPPLWNNFPETIRKIKDKENYRSVFDQRRKLIDLHEKGAYSVISLTDHLWRDDLPGYEFFEGSRCSSEIKLSRDIFFIELPEIMTDYRNILELRNVAQNAGLSYFWKMIKEQTEYANAGSEHSLKRAERVRDEFKKWCNDKWKFRGKSFAVIGLVAVAFVDSNYAPLATFAGADWIGELNQKWAQRKDIENKAFKFISRLHGKIRQLKNQ